jgi:sigma-E factor negative regulatory protein RseA
LSIMTDINRENLSAAVDGELSKEELRFLLRRLDHDATLLQTWARYHVAGASMRQELPPLAGGDFAARVMVAIEQDRSGSASVEKQPRHWLRWSAGGAIAASVAAAALIISQPTGGPGTDRAAPLTANAASPVSASGLTSPNANANVAPATVPPWLSGYSASPLSQRASITLGDPSDPSLTPYSYSISPYQAGHYRAVKSGDGSYLLLIDASQIPVARDQQRRPAAASGQ